TGPFSTPFNASLKIDFQGSRVTSDAGLILVREVDERLGFGELIQQHPTDSRRGKNTQFPFADLLRQSVYSRLAGYEDLNDAERLSQDPTFRLIGSEKIWDRGAALTSRLQSFETEMLTQEENFAGLARLNRALIGKAEAVGSGYRTILDMDSTEVPVYREQEQSAYNGYFESTCFHPLLLFNSEGDCLAAKLRPGNAHSAEGWEELLLPEIERQQETGKEVAFRADAAFAQPEVYEALEERGVKYAIRMPANDSLERDIAAMLPRPVGRPSQKPLVEYQGFLYRAASWKTARPVLAKVEHHAGELFPRVGFIGRVFVEPSWGVLASPDSPRSTAEWRTCGDTPCSNRIHSGWPGVSSDRPSDSPHRSPENTPSAPGDSR
ncbi:MAG TPA: IS1380 family transposase, partial [Candidatus Methylomirabilis sp.]|nr:IS1380 family transposase [Candidatus Methylomirabilis sp.]